MIKDEIMARGLTQKDLAQQMGASYTVFNEILNGKRPVTTELQHAEDEAGQIIHVALGEDSQDCSDILILCEKLVFLEGDAFVEFLVAFVTLREEVEADASKDFELLQFFKRNNLIEMLQEVIYSITERSKIVFNNIPHHIIIYIEIAMGYMITHSFYSLPRYFWTRIDSRICFSVSSTILN